ncbi:uncharacterized protein F4822DRAFT_433439 [Hypoxylon trugodes]|uniref:uncharacterized protein n=1 Tax=Hypoxylon trugodes TaxID=326681 RepID=UPI00218FAB1D|nr:uncharacterized protein F4822DRAFT_433439 [Hypoxylon trugodes]KAI1384900.1 hypothetical protein F4822DRAFT_433439 [Hypoxylon trugodes]
MFQPLCEDVRNLDADHFDTWLNKPHKGWNSTWLSRCKAYLPQLKSFRTVALSLSNLDPHKIAPWVITGLYLSAEVCFGTVDPLTRDKAMNTILKTNIIFIKWLDSEPDMRVMKKRKPSSDITDIESRLEKLYLGSLVLIFTIYKSGKTRGSRAIVKWIKPSSEDPEPAHQTVMERTGVDDPGSKAGRRFLETKEFTSWIDQIRTNEAGKKVFWLKGSMGAGKTTLICRVISHFEELPLKGIRFVRYYCFGSQAATESKAPTYETILRALCYQLAWNGNKGVAEPAKSLYENLAARNQTTEPLTRKRLEELLKNLLDYVRPTESPIVFVIDALDECESKDDSKKLLAFLKRLQQEVGGVYFFISSRPHINVGGHFKDSIQVFNPVQLQTEKDMEVFIKEPDRFKERGCRMEKKHILDDELRKQLELALLKSAGGMVSLDESLEETKKIENAYRRLWNITDDQYKKYQIRLFRIVMGSFERLLVQQLLEAVSFNPDNPSSCEDLELDELEGLYCNFFRISVTGFLEFEHISARVFISELKEDGSNKLMFSAYENQYTLVDIAIKTIERPNHWL